MSSDISSFTPALPTPIADVCWKYVTAENLNEKRDRIVEVQRSVLRFVGTVVLAEYFHRHPQATLPSNFSDVVGRLLQRHLTDGQWIALAREGLRPFGQERESLFCPAIREFFFQGNSERASSLAHSLDQLNRLRREETVAHGTSGSEEQCQAIIADAQPHLDALLNRTASLSDYSLLRAKNVTLLENGYSTRFEVLRGVTPRGMRFPTVESTTPEQCQSGHLYLGNGDSPSDLLPLHPFVLSEDNETDNNLLWYEGEDKFCSITSDSSVERAEASEEMRARFLDDESEALSSAIDPALIGRKKELNRLLNVFGDLKQSQGKVIFVEGELGVGKTRLMSEFLEVLYSRCLILKGRFGNLEFAEGYVSPLKGVRQLLLELFDLKRSDTDVAAGEKIHSQLSQSGLADDALISSVVSFVKGQTADDDIGNHADKIQLFQNLTTVLFRVSTTRPLVIFLDDIQWADKTTIEFLNHVANCLLDESADILIVCGYRPDGISDNPPLARFISVMSRHSQKLFYHAQLDRLDEEESQELVRGVLGEVSGEVLDYVVGRGQGNPFYLLEILRFLLDNDHLTERGGKLYFRDSSLAGIPSSLKSIIQDKLRRLSERPSGDQLLDILRWMAVFGSDCYFLALHRAIAQSSLASPELAQNSELLLEQLDQMGFIDLQYDERAADTLCTFHSEVLREVVWDDVLQKRRLRLPRYHQAAGEALENFFSDPDTMASTLAHHFGQGRDFQKAFRYTFEATQNAFGRFAYSEASELGRKLSKLAEKPQVKNEITDMQEYQLRFLLAQLAEQSGSYEKALSMYRVLLDHPVTDEDRIKHARVLDRVGQIFTRTGDWKSALERFEEVHTELDASARDSKFWLSHITSYASAKYVHELDIEEAIKMLREAYDHSREFRTSKPAGRLLAHLAIFSSETGRWDQALEYADLASSLFEQINATIDLGLIKATIGNVHFEMEAYDRVLPQYQKARDVFNRFDFPFGRATVLLNQGQLLCQNDRLEEAESAVEEARRLFKDANLQHAVSQCMLCLGIIRYFQKAYPAAEHLFHQVVEIQDRQGVEDVRDLSMVHNNLGCIALQTGAEGAVQKFQQAVNGFDQVSDQKRSILSRANLANAFSEIGEPSKVDAVLEEADAISLYFPSREKVLRISGDPIVLSRPKPNA